MIVIGLTGGIASGKSTVSEMLAELGARILNSDRLGHEVLRSRSAAAHDLVKTFGQGILQPDGEIDRSKLAAIVFGNASNLAQLNAIMHPPMYEEIKKKLERWQAEGVKVAVIEAAVLLEAHWESAVDQVWVTVASEETVLGRLKNKGFSEAGARARISSQMSNEERIRRADVVIDTDCSLSELRTRVKQAWQNLVV